MSKKVPYDIESEKSVVGSMIASEKVCSEALATLEVNDFYDPKNGILFKAILNLDSQNKAIDNAAVANELQVNMKKLDQIGGVDYLRELQDYYVGDKNALFHLRNVHDLALVRKLFNKAEELQNQFFNADFEKEKVDDVSGFISMYDTEMSKIIRGRTAGGFKSAQDVMTEISKDLQKRRGVKKSGVTGLDTGFKYLNALTSGWQPGTLNILAARPSVGKTAFAINLAYNAASLSKKTVAIFPLEMDSKSIIKRLLASISNVNSSSLRSGDLTDSDWMAIQEGEDKLNKVKIFIDDTSGISMEMIKTNVTKLKQQDPNLGLVVIDYLGLITLKQQKKDNRENIDEISRSLKGLARDLNIAVLCLCQLSRGNEKEKRRPIMSDLRDSGSIEQDADTVMMLYREDYQKTKEETQNQDLDNPFANTQIIEVNLIKNRNGGIGLSKLAFMMNINKFTEIQDEGNNQ